MATDDPILASVAGRYASAFFELASDEKKLAEVEADMNALARALEESEDLRRLVRSPVISADDQGRALEAIGHKAGFSPLGLNFVKLLARNRRLFIVEDVLKAFRQILARHRGEVTADVTSAHALTPDQLKAVEDSLMGTSGGRKVKIVTHVDPSLLGGLIVKMGSRMIDSSLRTKLATLKMRMNEVR